MAFWTLSPDGVLAWVCQPTGNMLRPWRRTRNSAMRSRPGSKTHSAKGMRNGLPRTP